jgi:hypothetical protein
LLGLALCFAAFRWPSAWTYLIFAKYILMLFACVVGFLYGRSLDF